MERIENHHRCSNHGPSRSKHINIQQSEEVLEPRVTIPIPIITEGSNTNSIYHKLMAKEVVAVRGEVPSQH